MNPLEVWRVVTKEEGNWCKLCTHIYSGAPCENGECPFKVAKELLLRLSNFRWELAYVKEKNRR